MSKPPARCPGCSHPISRVETWCNPCDLRLPKHLRSNVVTADRELRAAVAEATTWLEAHPHASDREVEIISRAAQGMENETIAKELHLSVHTVRDHWRRVMSRWGCTNRTQVVATAFQLGYLSVEDGPERKAAT